MTVQQAPVNARRRLRCADVWMTGNYPARFDDPTRTVVVFIARKNDRWRGGLITAHQTTPNPDRPPLANLDFTTWMQCPVPAPSGWEDLDQWTGMVGRDQGWVSHQMPSLAALLGVIAEPYRETAFGPDRTAMALLTLAALAEEVLPEPDRPGEAALLALRNPALARALTYWAEHPARPGDLTIRFSTS